MVILIIHFGELTMKINGFIAFSLKEKSQQQVE
jgi:hypothetical protein